MPRSTSHTKIISKNSKSLLDERNVYYLLLENKGSLAVTCRDNLVGSFSIDAGDKKEFPGHPNFPGDYTIDFEFNNASIETDFVEVTYMKTNG